MSRTTEKHLYDLEMRAYESIDKIKYEGDERAKYEYWADMGENVRGFFDRQRGVIVLNQRIGAAQAAYLTALHEFSHYMEGQPGYGQYAEAILTAAYGKGYEDSTAYKMDTGAVRDTYASNGRELTDDELKMELVSQAAEKIITGDEAFQRSMFGTKDAVSIKILAGLDHFINAKAAKKNGPEAAERYNLLRAARSSIRRAIQGAGQKSEGAQSGGVQYALLTETDAGARSGRLTDDRQIRISEPETVDRITAEMPDGDVELKKHLSRRQATSRFARLTIPRSVLPSRRYGTALS